MENEARVTLVMNLDIEAVWNWLDRLLDKIHHPQYQGGIRLQGRTSPGENTAEESEIVILVDLSKEMAESWYEDLLQEAGHPKYQGGLKILNPRR